MQLLLVGAQCYPNTLLQDVLSMAVLVGVNVVAGTGSVSYPSIVARTLVSGGEVARKSFCEECWGALPSYCFVGVRRQCAVGRARGLAQRREADEAELVSQIGRAMELFAERAHGMSNLVGIATNPGCRTH